MATILSRARLASHLWRGIPLIMIQELSGSRGMPGSCSFTRLNTPDAARGSCGRIQTAWCPQSRRVVLQKYCAVRNRFRMALAIQIFNEGFISLSKLYPGMQLTCSLTKPNSIAFFGAIFCEVPVDGMCGRYSWLKQNEPSVMLLKRWHRNEDDRHILVIEFQFLGK